MGGDQVLVRHDRALPGADRAGRGDRPLRSLESPPGTTFAYSNFGFGLLGIAAGRAAGVPFRELVARRILGPLGMTSTVWDAGAVPSGRLATAYRAARPGPVVVPHWRLGASEGAGGLYSSVRDMAKYVAFQLAAYPPRDAPEGPVRRASVREGHHAAVVPQLFVGRDSDGVLSANARSYGFAWGLSSTCDDAFVVEHSGGTEGYRAQVTLLPDAGVGVVVLANISSANPYVVADKLLGVLRKAGGLAPRVVRYPLSPELDAAMGKLMAVMNDWDEAAYRAMMSADRAAEGLAAGEREELAGYHARHGACVSHEPIEVTAPGAARFALRCARGRLEMSLEIDRGRVTGFAGESHDLPAAPALARVAAAIAALVGAWDAKVYRAQLAPRVATPPQAVAARLARVGDHRACKVVEADTSLSADGTTTFRLTCAGGRELRLTLGAAKDGALVELVRLAPADPPRCPR